MVLALVDTETERRKQVSDTLVKLKENWLCACESLPSNELVPCHRRAHWMINDIPVCDADIREIAGLNSDNERFLRPALDDIAERHERRNLFVAAMRKPEMRVLRLALRYLSWGKGLDWREIQEIEMFWYGYREDCCMLLTKRYSLVCLDACKPDLMYEEFFFVWRHDESNPACPCEYCCVDDQCA